jgi:hypothetical protein
VGLHALHCRMLSYVDGSGIFCVSGLGTISCPWSTSLGRRVKCGNVACSIMCCGDGRDVSGLRQGPPPFGGGAPRVFVGRGAVGNYLIWV